MLTASLIIPVVYLALPIATLGLTILRIRRTRNPNFLRDTLMVFTMGAVGGLVLSACYMRAFNGNVPGLEVLVACYWGVAVACALKALNGLVKWSIARVIRVNAAGKACCPAANVAASVLRSIVLLGVAVPYLASMLLMYRPHILNEGTPQSILGKDFQDVTFTSTDGLTLRGWWIPAAPDPSDTDANSAPPAGRTIIVCHGFVSDKASDLKLVRDLVPGNFNVLAFDFRAHGQSDGQLCTFGDLERRDVLGAVRWLKMKHPAESQKIYGLGVGLGSAALIAAAADPDDGQSIDAVAVLAPYDRLSHLVQDSADAWSVPRLGSFINRVALPLGGVQVGSSLSRFAPEALVDKIAPRPLLVIASEQDSAMDVSLSQEFYERASQPKYAYWVKKGGRRSMLFKNESVSRTLRVFFETARDIL